MPPLTSLAPKLIIFFRVDSKLLNYNLIMKVKLKIMLALIILLLTFESFRYGKSHQPRKKDVGFSSKADHNDASASKLSKSDYSNIYNQKLSVDKAIYGRSESVNWSWYLNVYNNLNS